MQSVWRPGSRAARFKHHEPPPARLGPSRAAISDAQQQLDLNAFAGPLETPVLGGAAAKRSGVSFADVPETPAAGPASTSQLVSDILLHRNPPLTCLAAGAGALLLAAAWVLLHGAHGLTLLTGACSCLVLRSRVWCTGDRYAKGLPWSAGGGRARSEGDVAGRIPKKKSIAPPLAACLSVATWQQLLPPATPPGQHKRSHSAASVVECTSPFRWRACALNWHRCAASLPPCSAVLCTSGRPGPQLPALPHQQAGVPRRLAVLNRC